MYTLCNVFKSFAHLFSFPACDLCFIKKNYLLFERERERESEQDSEQVAELICWFSCQMSLAKAGARTWEFNPGLLQEL